MNYKALVLLEDATVVAAGKRTVRLRKQTDTIDLQLQCSAASSYHVAITDLAASDFENRIGSSGIDIDRLLVINKRSSSGTDEIYMRFVQGGEHLRFHSLKLIDEANVSGVIERECVKHLWRNNLINGWSALWARGFLWMTLKESRLLSLLLPFVVVLAYFGWKRLVLEFGFPQFYILCYLIDYKPDCQIDWKSEVLFFTLVYSAFNLISYFGDVFRLFENMGSIRQFKFGLWSLIHRFLRLAVLLLFFLSLLIVCKALFFFLHGAEMNADLALVGSIESVLDSHFPPMSIGKLLWVFLVLDLSLFLFTANYMKMIRENGRVSELRRRTIRDAQSAFVISTFLTSAVAFVVWLSSDDGKLSTAQEQLVGLVVVQFFYLVLNMKSSFDGIKHL